MDEKNSATMFEDSEGVLFHFHLSDNTPQQTETLELSDGSRVDVIWKDVLVEGEYPMSPGPGGAVDKPMTVIRDGKSDYSSRTIAMSDLEFAHKDGAFKYVTIPTRHADQPADNTGYVPQPDGVRVIERDGKQVFQAALGFTEPDIKGKVERGTIPDVSGGIFFKWLNKHTRKAYNAAMKHVCLTPVPFMGNLEPFKPVFASDEEIDEVKEVRFFEFAEGDNSGDGGSASGDSAEVVWNETSTFGFMRRQVDEALNPREDSGDGSRPVQAKPYYSVIDVHTDGDKALVEEYYKGNSTKFIVPFKIADDGAELAPQLRWTEVREAMVAASDPDFEDVSTSTLRDKLSLALSDTLGAEAKAYRIEDVSLDSRARIRSTADGAGFIAQFSVTQDGDVLLSPSSAWEEAPAAKPAEGKKQQKPAPKKAVTLSDDPLRSRLDAARTRRRQLLS